MLCLEMITRNQNGDPVYHVHERPTYDPNRPPLPARLTKVELPRKNAPNGISMIAWQLALHEAYILARSGKP